MRHLKLPVKEYDKLFRVSLSLISRIKNVNGDTVKRNLTFFFQFESTIQPATMSTNPDFKRQGLSYGYRKLRLEIINVSNTT